MSGHTNETWNIQELNTIKATHKKIGVMIDGVKYYPNKKLPEIELNSFPEW